MNVSISIWIALLALVIAMLLIDLFMHRSHNEISNKEAVAWSSLWILCGVAVGIFIWIKYGSDYGLQYFSGYIIEKSLAIDNVFVWGILFSSFAVPIKYQHRVLFLGVVGALVMRAGMIAAGTYFIKEASWILYVFGAFLIYSGIKMFIQRNEHFDWQKIRSFKFIQRKLRVTSEFHGEKFFVRQNGLLWVTPLFLALIIVEITDVIFAVDSIPAIFAVTEEPFLVFASNALALLGLRSLYFLIANLLNKFEYLKIGLSWVLVWVGIKMIYSHAIAKIPTSLSIGIIIAILGVAILASIRKARKAVIE